MKNKVFELINKLISLSGSKYTKEQLEKELSDYNININMLLEKLANFKNELSEERYFDQSAKVIDQNMELSLQTELNNLENKLKQVLENYTNIKNSIEKTTWYMNKQKDSIKLYDELLKKTASNSVKESVGNKQYEEMIAYTEGKLNKAINNKNFQNKKLESLVEKETLIKNEKEVLEKNIKSSKNKLEELKIKLKDNKNYYNEALKIADNSELTKLEEELKTAERAKLALMTTPYCLANDLKNLVNDDKHIESGFKLKELISVLETLPYINDNNKKELEKELNKLNKRYIFLKERVSKNEYISDNKKNLNNLKVIINKVIKDLINDKENILKIKNNVDKERIPYFFDKIKKYDLEDNFNEVLDNLFKYSNVLNHKLLNNIDNDIEQLEILLETIDIKVDKEQDDSLKKKDLIEIKELDKSIRLLERRIASDKSIVEMYEELDMLLSSLEFADDMQYIKVVKITDIKDLDYKIDIGEY